MVALSRLNAKVVTQTQREAVGELIRWHREQKGLSQRELARRLGVSNATIWRVENGEISPRNRAELVRYAQALRLTERDTNTLLECAGYVVTIVSTPDANFEWQDKYFVAELFAVATEAFHVHGNLSRSRLFLEHLHKGIPESDDIDLLKVKAEASLNLAWVYQAEGSHSRKQILNLMREAEVLTVRAKDPHLELEAIKGQGLAYGNEELYLQALRYYQKADYRARNSRLDGPRAMLQRDMLIAQGGAGMDVQNAESRNTALSLLNKLGDQYGANLLMEAYARTLSEAGHHQQATTQITRALDILKDTNLQPLHRVILLNTATRVFLAAGDITIGLHFAAQTHHLCEQFGYDHQMKRLTNTLRRYLLPDALSAITSSSGT